MSFTSKAPHSCEHCQRITLNLKLNDQATQFSCGAKEVIAADQAGCPLFHAFIESVVGKANKARFNECFSSHYNLSFTLQYEKEGELNPAALCLSVRCVPDDGTEKPEQLGASRLQLWTCEGDSASIEITSRPYEMDYASPASVEFARSCIGSCQGAHRECRRQGEDTIDNLGPELIDPNSIPSRLLQLVTKDSALHVKLVGRDLPSAIPKETVSRQGFAILSYCWGVQQPVQLTRDSINRLGDGIPIAELPKTLHDAAWYTNEVGLEYLWIDALCIMQDDFEDKLHEVPRMELYYGHSTVTICAASAARCSDGFLGSREEDPTNYSVGPIKLRVETSTGAPGYVQAVGEADHFNSKRPQEPITLRGWTLQESLLSRRILIFSSRQLYFTCTVANASCGGFERKLKSRTTASFGSQVDGIHTLSGLRYYPIRNIWHIIISEYTRRHLGFSADKLPAVSALASSLPRMAKERNQTMEYLAGLVVYVSDEVDTDTDWRAELLWTVDRMESTRYIPGRGPSFSWCSVDGPIELWSLNRPTKRGDTEKTRLCEYGAELESELAPFGAVKGAYMKLHARLKSLESLSVATGVKYMISTQIDNENRPGATLVLSPDTREAARIVKDGLQGRERVFLLELISYHNKYFTSPAGIIVDQIPSTGHYVRLGIFEFGEPGRMTPAEEVEAMKSFFEDSPWQYVHLV
ncbi:HET-domain-containing protein [Hypoxylon sp. FL0543]|nr:HET-domain-containing protein [Hypoxylon sp. FL0543]